jgi:hypothetical protein
MYQSSSNIGIGTTTPVGKLQINLNNTDYTNTGGAGSHIVLNNPNAGGQNVISSVINGTLVGKIRNDYVGNIAYTAGGSGVHIFFTGGDYLVGSPKMIILNNGNVGIGALSPSYNLEVANTVAFPNLTNSTSAYVVGIDNSTGELYKQAAGAGGTFPYTGSAEITGSLGVTGSIGHDFNQFNTLYTYIEPAAYNTILTFDPTSYYSCFIEYHVFLDSTPKASRAGNIRISVPYNYTDLDGLNNIPFVENATEWYTDLSNYDTTTEDIYFKVNYNSSIGKIEVFMFNDNNYYNAYINAEYRLIGFKI